MTTLKNPSVIFSNYKTACGLNYPGNNALTCFDVSSVLPFSTSSNFIYNSNFVYPYPKQVDMTFILNTFTNVYITGPVNLLPN